MNEDVTVEIDCADHYERASDLLEQLVSEAKDRRRRVRAEGLGPNDAGQIMGRYELRLNNCEALWRGVRGKENLLNAEVIGRTGRVSLVRITLRSSQGVRWGEPGRDVLPEELRVHCAPFDGGSGSTVRYEQMPVGA